MAENNLLGALDGGLVDWKNLIRDSQQGIERGLNEIGTADGDITMKNLLENFRVCDQTLAITNQALQDPLRVDFVRVRSSDKIHRDIGVQKNHLLESAK